MDKILYSWSQSLFSIGNSNILSTAFINEDGIIYPDSIVHVTVANGSNSVSIHDIGNGKFMIGFTSAGGVILKLSYTDIDDIVTELDEKMVMEDGETEIVTESGLDHPQYVEYVSFVVTESQVPTSVVETMSIIKQELPDSVFSDSGSVIVDRSAFATLCNEVSSDVLKNTLNAFPELSSDQQWMQELWSISQTIGIGNGVSYPELFQFLRNLDAHCSFNPFDLAYNVSKFIYLITGKYYAVYADEIFDAAKNTFWVRIMDPNLPTELWVVGESVLGTSTILGKATELETQIQNSIGEFVQRIARYGVPKQVDFLTSFASLGLNTKVQNTYAGDKNLYKTYCIQYNPLSFTSADGFIHT
jgi:hypothetical protein